MGIYKKTYHWRVERLSSARRKIDAIIAAWNYRFEYERMAEH